MNKNQNAVTINNAQTCRFDGQSKMPNQRLVQTKSLIDPDCSLIQTKKSDVKKLRRKLRKLNISYDEYIKRKNYNKKIDDINKKQKQLKKEIHKLNLKRKN